MNALTLESILGGSTIFKQKVHSALDWITLIRQGLPVAAVDSVTKMVKLTQSELGITLGIPERTLARRKREGKLRSEESAKLLRLARVLKRAVEVFEENEKAIDWLKHPNRALGRYTPLSLLDTEVGANNVMDILGRIEEGVFS